MCFSSSCGLRFSVPVSFFLIFTTPKPAVKSTVFNFVLSTDLCINAAHRGFCAGCFILLFVDFGEEASIVGSATASYTGILGKNFLRRKLHDHELPCKKKAYQVISSQLQTPDHFKTFFYLYSSTADHDMLEALVDLYTGSSYACDSHVVHIVSLFASSSLAALTHPHSFVAGDVESNGEHGSGIFIGEDRTKKPPFALPNRRYTDARKPDFHLLDEKSAKFAPYLSKKSFE